MIVLKKKYLFIFVILIIVYIGLYIYEKTEVDKFFNNKKNIRNGMRVSELIKLVGKPTYEMLVDSASIIISDFPKELRGNNKKYYIFIYTVPSLKEKIWKFNNLFGSYEVYVDEKKEKVVFF